MKKFVSVFLACAVFLSAASGCSSSQTDESEDSFVSQESIISSSGSASSEEYGDALSSPSVSAPGEVTVEEQVLLEEKGLRITASGLDFKDESGPELHFTIENSTDSALTVQTARVSVNGYMVEAFCTADIPAQTIQNASIWISSDELLVNGIAAIADIELAFVVHDSETQELFILSDPVQVLTSAAEGFTYTFNDSGNPLYESGSILRVVSKGYSPARNEWASAPLLYLENNAGTDILVQITDISLNNTPAELSYAFEIAAGKRLNTELMIPVQVLQNAGIDTLDSVSMAFHVQDLYSQSTEIDASSVLTVFR